MADSIFLDFQQGVISKSGRRYSVLQLLGTGGNAATFLVLATSGVHQGQLFALKLFRRLSKPERRDSFLKEVAFLRSCDHPAIMRVFDDGVFNESHPFVVAEYLPLTLRRLMQVGATTLIKLSLTLQLLSALRYLAALPDPVVHRDIKPENIFIKDRTCVLGDFGLLKHLHRESDDDRSFLKESVGAGMSRRYRSPELVAYARGEAGLNSIARSDVFQLGLVLAELFAGKNPARPPDASNLLSQVRVGPLGRIRGALGPPIRALIERMILPDPAARGSTDDLLTAWQRVFEDAAERANALEGHIFSN